jgi:hypothetical protein
MANTVASGLQSVFALSTTEATCVALSTALHDVILVMELLKEMKKQGYDVVDTASFLRITVELLNKQGQLNINRELVTITLHGIISGCTLARV